MASSKRAYTKATDATEVVNCLVDGCMDDLSNCRKYHQKHKVCEAHSKSPQVLINGQTLRFCQQCSRFHSLEEFDKEKRSCRKRLDEHNKRRRKPQPCLFSPETNMLQFGGQPAHPSIAFMNPRFNKPPAGRMDQSDYAQFLLSSSSGSSGTTLSHVVHPPSAGSFPTISSHLDPGLRFGSLEYEFDAGWDGMTNMEPHD